MFLLLLCTFVTVIVDIEDHVGSKTCRWKRQKKKINIQLSKREEVLGGWPESAHLDHDTPVNGMIK
jgi:hypothetical protein